MTDKASLLWRRAARRVGGHRLLAAIVVVLILITGSAIVVWLVEQGRNPNVNGPSDGFYWMAVTMVTAPPWPVETSGGRLAYYAILVVKPGLMALVTAAIAANLLQIVLRLNSGSGRTRVKDHIVICGWSAKGNEIISEIRGRQDEEASRPCVVLAPLEKNPSADERTSFINGDPTNAADLERANLPAARTVIILADNSHPGIDVEEMDAKTLMVVLAVESVAPDVYSCVEIVHSHNRHHFERTKADELLVSAKLTGALLAHSAATHGLSKVIDELVSFPGGNEFYWTPVPAAMVGKQFHEALSLLKQSHEAVPMAVSVAGKKGFIVNPPANYELSSGDRLLVISEQAPRFDL